MNAHPRQTGPEAAAETEATAAPTFSRILRAREFRSLWLADIQSALGDQLARVALAILVYDRTNSGLATAGVYALTFLPALFGNVVLGAMADRLPRRQVLVGGDLVRGLLLAVMALPGMPTFALMALLSVAVLIGAPWSAAETALVTEIVAESDFAVGLGLRAATAQAAQLLGFAGGGLAVALVGTRSALAIDAATFVVSAIVIRFGVRLRPNETANGDSRRWAANAGDLLRDPRLRLLLAFSSLLGLLVVPEGLAAPYARILHGGPSVVGLLLASGPAGVLVGSLIFSRWVPETARAHLLGPLAVAAGLPLLGCAFIRDLPVTMALWALSGAATAYHVQVVTEYVRTVAVARRGQAIGLASAGLLAAQGVGLLAGGAVAQWLGTAVAVAMAGGTASMCAAVLTVLRRRSSALASA